MLLGLGLQSSPSGAAELITISPQTERVILNPLFRYRVTHDNFSLARIDLNNADRWESFSAFRSHQSGTQKPRVWAATQLFNRSSMQQRYVVDLGDAYIEQASVYLITLDGEVIDSASVAFEDALVQRPYIAQQLMLPVELPANKTVWLVLSANQWPQQINQVSLWAPEALQLHQQRHQTALGINAGVLFLLSVAAFTLARGTGRRLQISLGVTSVAFIIVMLLHSGLWITYLSPYSPSVAAQLLPYMKQLLITSLVWLLLESSQAWLRRSRWPWLMRAAMTVSVLLWLAQPWWSALLSPIWLSAQMAAVGLLTFAIAIQIVRRRKERLVHWFVVLLIPLMAIAWLLIAPRFSMLWQGLSGIALYSLLTVNILALILAQLDKAVHRQTRRIDSIKAIKQRYQSAYWQLLGRSGEGWFELNSDHTWRRANQQFLKQLGLPRFEVLRRHWPKVNDVFGAQARAWSDGQRKESWRHLESVERFDGKTIWLDVEIFNDGTGRALDVTQRVEAEMHLNFLSKHDPLTGVFNSREFKRLVQKRLDSGGQTTLLLTHIGGLQMVYDQLGAESRDQVLLQLVLSAKRVLPRGARVARLGEQRLAILLDDTEQAGFALAYQLLQVCREFRYTSATRVFQFTGNVGLVQSTVETLNVETLLNRAVDALKLARQSGDFKVHSAKYDDQRRLLRQAEQDWEATLRDALANEKWQLYQQPMVSANAERDKHCFEILLRLPNRANYEIDEALATQHFLSAALNAGIMAKADRWLIRKVLDYFADNAFEATRTWRCHINLSSQSLEDEDFINFLGQELEQASIRPEQLAFELAEPDVAEHFDRAYELFKQLQRLGCHTVIDQLGTGFNSFRLLRQLPLTQVKINRFWVQNMLLDPVEAELVLSCVRVAQAAGIEVGAVGIENEETRTALIKEEINYLQGYVCGRPQPW